MWEYVKGSEADFEGAPEWATLKVASWWIEDKIPGSKWVSVHGGNINHISNNGLYAGYPIKAERRKVDNLQSRVNDANLTEALITERGTRYGEFKDGAAIMQQLKDVMKGAPKWEALKPSQKEALEMIQHKIGRILNGDPDYDDNWKDIAGYATLIVKELSK